MSDTELQEQVNESAPVADNTSGKTLGELLSSEEIKASPKLAKLINQSVDTLAKSYINADSMIGKRIDQMSPEDIIQFNKKLGAPERSDDYRFAREQEVPQEKLRELKDKYQKAGLNHLSAESLFNDVVDSLKQVETKEKVDLEAVKDLNQSKLFDKYGKNFKGILDLVEQELIDKGGLELRDKVLDPVNMNHEVIDIMYKVVKEKRPQSVLAPEQGGRIAMTGADAQLELDRLRASSEFRRAFLHNDQKAMKVFNNEVITLLAKIRDSK